MRLPLAILLAAGACVAASGCRSNTQQIEAELRARETDVRELRDELDHCIAHNRGLQFEMRSLHGMPPGPVAPDGTGLSYPLRSLSLGRQTGGREMEGLPGDGALQVVLEPHDAEDQSIKVPNASALIQVAEIAPEGMKQPLSSWDIPAEQLRNYWRTGLLTTGYVLVLPWKEPPTTDKLRVTVVLRLADGRCFEADKDISIRLPPGVKRRIMPPAQPVSSSPDGPVLPAPRVIDSGGTGAAPDRTPPGPRVSALVSRKRWWDVGEVKVAEPPASLGRPVSAP